jgi:undecaprenyl-diphosphatase
MLGQDVRMPVTTAGSVVTTEVPVDGRTALVDEVPVLKWMRHPGDVLRAVVALVALLFALAVFEWGRSTLRGLEEDLSGAFEGWVRTVLVVSYGLFELAAAVVPLVLLGWLLRRRHWRLLGVYAVTLLVTNSLYFLLEEWLTERTLRGANLPADVDQASLTFLIDAQYMAAFAAALTVTGPWMSRRWHRAAWLLLLCVIPLRLLVGYDVPTALLLAMGAGWFIGSVALLAFGAPTRTPSGAEVVRSLDEAGIRLAELRRAGVDARGSTPYFATDVDGGRHFVKVLGNDERSADLMFRVIRYLRLRNVGDERPFSSLRRAVEHEGMVSVWAERAGVRTPRTEAVVSLPDSAMALVYSLEQGKSLDSVDPATITDDFLHGMWQQVQLLRQGGIAHRDLRRANVFRTDDGDPMVIDFGFGEVSASRMLLDQDVAQLILSTAVDVGPERAVRAAIGVLGPQAVADAAPRMQVPALSGATQAALRKNKGLLEETRTEVIAQTGIDEIELVPLQRVKPRTVITLVIIAALTWVLIPQISEVPELLGEIREADLRFAGLALVFSLLTYVGAAVALNASVPIRLSVSRTTLVTLAGSFVNRISPVKVGGMALNVRYLQKAGLETTVAGSSIGLQSLVGLVTHLALLVVFAVWAGQSVDYTEFLPRGTILYVVLGLVLGLVGAAAFVPVARRFLVEKVKPQLGKVVGNLRDLLHRPGRLALLVGGSALLTLSYVAALYASMQAFGGTLGVAAVAVVFLAGASIASAAPTPGGIGAVEAALIGGLTALGMSATVALPTVFLYRLATFWIPVLPGWAAFTVLQRRDEI